MTVLAEPLTRTILAQAPGCSVSFDSLPATHEEVERQLSRRDLVIAPLGFGLPGLLQPVFTDHLVCIVARNHPRLVDGGLSLEDLRAMPHAVASFLPDGGYKRPLEVAAETSGFAERTVQVAVTSLLTLPFAVAGTDLCAFVPFRLAQRCLDILDLEIATTPLAPIEIIEAAHVYSGRASAPTCRWLSTILYDVAVELEDQVAELSDPP